MDILVGIFLLAAIACLLIYLLHSNHGENSSIPYVKYKNHPIVGHLFPFLRDRTKFLMDCQERYGQCFKIRLLNQRFILILSPPDWASVIRNQSFYFPVLEHGKHIFGLSNDMFGR